MAQDVFFECVCGQKLTNASAISKHKRKVCKYWKSYATQCALHGLDIKLNMHRFKITTQTIDVALPNPPSDAAKIELANAFIELYKSRPDTSPLKRPLLGDLSQRMSLPARSIANMFGVSTKTVSNSRNCDRSILNLKTNPLVQRTTNVTSTSIEFIEKFWLENTRPSPTRTIQTERKRRTKQQIQNNVVLTCDETLTKPVHFQDNTTTFMYTLYKNDCKDAKTTTHSRKIFEKYKPNNIKPAKKVEGLCYMCQEFATHSEWRELCVQYIAFNEHNKGSLHCMCQDCTGYTNKISEMNAADIALSHKLFAHKHIVQKKREEWKKVKSQLQENEIIVVMDFASGFEVPNKYEETVGEWWAKRLVKDMVVVIITKHDVAHYDLLSDDEHHDHHYVREAWNNLFETASELKNINKLSVVRWRTCSLQDSTNCCDVW